MRGYIIDRASSLAFASSQQGKIFRPKDSLACFTVEKEN